MGVIVIFEGRKDVWELRRLAAQKYHVIILIELKEVANFFAIES